MKSTNIPEKDMTYVIMAQRIQKIYGLIYKAREKNIKNMIRYLKRVIYYLVYKPIYSPCVILLAYPFCFFSKLRFLNVHITRIGHLCVEPDCFIKEGVLGLRPQYSGAILASRNDVANTHLVEYWRKYFYIITNPFVCMLLRPLYENRFTGYNIDRYCMVIDTGGDYAKIETAYLGRPPLLKLSDNDESRGRDVLRGYGLKDSDWFVCVHAREDGYAPGEEQTYRNTKINDLKLAIQEIVNRGGWVFRMGDPSMTKLEPMDKVVDYAHSEHKTDWLDLYLLSKCRFILGCASGLYALAHIFGRPGVAVNNAPLSTVLQIGVNDIGIPKMVWSDEKKRLLTFRELFESPVSNYRFDSRYKESKVHVIDNTPEEIRDVTIEMLNRLDNKQFYTGEEDLQNKFKKYMRPHHYSYGAVSRVGNDFLKKYKELL